MSKTFNTDLYRVPSHFDGLNKRRTMARTKGGYTNSVNKIADHQCQQIVHLCKAIILRG